MPNRKGEFDPAAGRLPRAVMQAARAMKQRTDQVLADCSLTQRQFEILQILDRMGEMTGADLSRAAKVAPQTMAPCLEILEHGGYLTRTFIPGEGHRHRVEITDEGRKVCRSAQARMGALERAVRKALGPECVSSLVEELFALGNALSAMG